MTTVIKPKRAWSRIDFVELVRFKDLFYFLSWRDIKVRYKQTAIGIVWALFLPVITMIIFTIFFGNFAQISSNGVPYPIFVYVGVLFWNFFSQSINNASASLVGNEGIIKKIYFPKLLLPAASIFVCLVDFLIANLVLLGLMAYYRFLPSWQSLLVVPLLIVLTYLVSLGFGLFLAAVNVKFRDVRFVTPLFIQLLFFVTPVIYPSSIVSPEHQWILNLNPMSGIIGTARAVIFGETIIDWTALGMAVGVTVVSVLIGLVYFRKTERYFADII
ncbi:MAG TPA: phosphate ABC transporter permease [Candidatus Kerfeldbacteria bacterium]|nr:phosphate ABC transporter permease [Candidatus Kerfeldbacteria bacterium]